jgi:hypothetical protein
MNLEEIIKEADKVEGWFSGGEMSALYPYVTAIRNDGILVELGTYHGKSTLFYRLSNPNIKILTIDVCEQYPVGDPKIVIPKAIDADILAKGNIFQIPGDSHKIVKGFNWMIDFLFIDTRHTYENTMDDLNEWTKFVKGYIALHDCNEGFPGVVQAVDEFVAKNPQVTKIEIPAGMALLKV